MSVVPPLENLYTGLADGLAKVLSGHVAIASAGTDYVSPSGAYVNPSWITSLEGPKITGNISGAAASITGTVTEAQVVGLVSDLTSLSTSISTNTTAISAKATDNAVVHLTGPETVTGVKTFSVAINGSISGNAGTVTNGVYTSGAYVNPSWITSLAASKLTDLIPVANGGLNSTGITGILKGTGTAYAAAVDGTDFTSPTYIASRGQNLFTNGSGLMGNNYNFPGFTFDQVETYSGKGSFADTHAGGSRVYASSELIPIDPSKTYRLSTWAKSGNSNGSNYSADNAQYFGVTPYDIDGLTVGPAFYLKVVGSTDTTLAVALNPGDTTVTLSNATGWSGISSPAHARNLAWWPYTNSFGYSYSNYTYTRKTTLTANSAAFSNADGLNVTLGLWPSGGITGNVITLRNPWAGPSLPVGTPIRNCLNGGTYLYTVMSSVTVPNAWTRYEGTLAGLNLNGTTSNSTFPYGTAYVTMLALPNYTATTTNTVRFSSIWFSEISSSNLEPASATLPGVVSTTAQTFAGDKTFAGNMIVGTAALATTATTGFPYVPTCLGTPTGVPGTQAGRAPFVVDSTNNKAWFYVNGAWKYITLT